MKKFATEAYRMLSNTYVEIAISERACSEWFKRFKNGDFNIEYRHGAERGKVFTHTELEALLHKDSCQTQEELAATLGVTQQAISRRLKAMETFRNKNIGCRTSCLKGNGRNFCIAL
ncbi:hypothetical protein Trydic_g8873 [Trypoxylus dichotomus]